MGMRESFGFYWSFVFVVRFGARFSTAKVAQINDVNCGVSIEHCELENGH